MNRVTLARALSKLGAASRKAARDLCASGRVKVDGRVVRDPDHWLDLSRAEVTLDGRTLARDLPVHVALHKPPGVVTTCRDEKGRRTVIDLMPERWKRLRPIGRLDLASSGLLLLSNDARFGEAVTSPATAVEKEYEVELDRPLTPEHARALAAPMELTDGTRLLPARVAGSGCAIRLVIVEGRNRQIRRMCEQLGYRVERLHRTRIGPVQLGDLEAAATRPLSAAEVRALLACGSSRGRRGDEGASR